MTGPIKVVGGGFEGFVDWIDSTVSKSIEEREAEMSSLTTRFAAQLRK